MGHGSWYMGQWDMVHGTCYMLHGTTGRGTEGQQEEGQRDKGTTGRGTEGQRDEGQRDKGTTGRGTMSVSRPHCPSSLIPLSLVSRPVVPCPSPRLSSLVPLSLVPRPVVPLSLVPLSLVRCLNFQPPSTTRHYFQQLVEPAAIICTKRKPISFFRKRRDL